MTVCDKTAGIGSGMDRQEGENGYYLDLTVPQKWSPLQTAYLE